MRRTELVTLLTAALLGCPGSQGSSAGAGGSSANGTDDPSGTPGMADMAGTGEATAGAGTADNCPMIQGAFQPTYTMLNGTCGPWTNGNIVRFENNILIEKYADVDVETETIVMGCSVSLVQIVRDKMGAPQQRIVGPSLEVHDANLVTGTVTQTRYDAQGAQVCTGDYDAMLVKSSLTLGGAASSP